MLEDGAPGPARPSRAEVKEGAAAEQEAALVPSRDTLGMLK